MKRHILANKESLKIAVCENGKYLCYRSLFEVAESVGRDTSAAELVLTHLPATEVTYSTHLSATVTSIRVFMRSFLRCTGDSRSGMRIFRKMMAKEEEISQKEAISDEYGRE